MVEQKTTAKDEKTSTSETQREQDEKNGVKGSPEVNQEGSPVLTTDEEVENLSHRFDPVQVRKEDVETNGKDDPLNRPAGIYADNENAALQERINAAREGRKPVDEYVPFHGSPRNVLDAFAEKDENA